MYYILITVRVRFLYLKCIGATSSCKFTPIAYLFLADITTSDSLAMAISLTRFHSPGSLTERALSRHTVLAEE